MKLIDKDAVLADIERLKDSVPYFPTIAEKEAYKEGVDSACCKVNSFEVKEVDIEEEVESLIKSSIWRFADKEDFLRVAKHFFELGLNASNPLTWEDINEILYAERLVLREFGTQERSNEELCNEVLKRLKRTERIMVMEQPVILQSNCESCQLYEGFGQCFEHGNNLVENCKDYKKGE